MKNMRKGTVYLNISNFANIPNSEIKMFRIFGEKTFVECKMDC